MIFRKLIVGLLAAGIVLAGGVTSAVQANTGEDVTDSVASNVVVSDGISFNVQRMAPFEGYGDWVYSYTAYLSGVPKLKLGDVPCETKLNGEVIDSSSCADVLAFYKVFLDKDGAYSVTAGGKELASWVFTNPNVAPPAMKDGVCKITNVKVVKATDKGSVLLIKTNNKCRDGYWSYGYKTSDGHVGAGMTGVVNGRMTLSGMNIRKIKGLKLSVSFTPSEENVRSTTFNVKLR